MERNLGRKIGRKIERTPDGRQLWR
jgi:hypothetical protein